jgi:hypothetical protein
MPPPITDPLIHASTLVYKGAFRLPSSGGRYDFPGGGLCYNAANDSLFVTSYVDFHSTGEITIPTPIKGAPSLSALNRAEVIQPIADPSDGSWVLLNNGSGIHMGGMLTYGGRLIVTYYRSYDTDGSQPYSHWARNPTLIPGSDYVGPVTLQVTDAVGTSGVHAGSVSGYMGTIPAAWQTAFGGPCLTGQCGISIFSRTSLGPGVFSFNPDDIGSVNPVPTTPLVFYPGAHPTLGVYGDPTPNNLFNGTMQMGGVCFPEGSRSVLFFGLIGIGEYHYGNGTPDPSLNGTLVPGYTNRYYFYDPVFQTPGDHAYPYIAQVWAYDAAELADVAAGTRDAWTVVPYETWQIPSDYYSFNPRPAGAAYRASTGEIFILKTFGDGDAPLVDVYQLPAPSTDRYVATTGSNANAGTIDAPWRDIAYGALQVTAGVTLWVRGGTYDESLTACNSGTGTSWADANLVRIAAYPGETVWMTPSVANAGSNIIWFDADIHFVEFDGINLDGRPTRQNGLWTSTNNGHNPHHIRFQNAEAIAGMSLPGEAGAAVISLGAHANIGGATGFNWVRNCTLHGGGAPGLCGVFCAAVGVYIQGPNNIVEQSDIYDTGGVGIQIYNGTGDAPDNNTIRRNRIHDITRLGDPAEAWGILVSQGLNNRVENNLVYRVLVGNQLGDGGIAVAGVGTTVWYNTVYGNLQSGIIVGSGAVNALIQNNITDGNGSDYSNNSGSTVANHNLIGLNPLFVDAATDDFHLRVNSPARGTAIGLLQVPTDFDGNPRPTSGASDAGAYQFTSSSTNSGTAAVAVRGPGVAASGQTSGGGGPAAVAIKGPTVNATGRSTLIGTATSAVKGPTINAGGGGASVTGTVASAIAGPTITASGSAPIAGTAALAVKGPTVLGAGGQLPATGTITLSVKGPALAATGQGQSSGYVILGIGGPSVVGGQDSSTTGTATVAVLGPRINSFGAGVSATGTGAAATAGPTVSATSSDNAGAAAAAILGPTIASAGTTGSVGTVASATAGPSVQASGSGIGVGTATSAIAGPSVAGTETAPYVTAIVTGLDGNCARNEITITGLHFQAGATIVLTGYLDVVETFDLVSLAPAKIVLNNLNPPLLSRTQYCVTVTNP